MAAGLPIQCTRCDFGFDAWDDGNPYFRAEDGRKVYWHHPQPEPYEDFVREKIGAPGDFADPAEYLKARMEVLRGRIGNEIDCMCRDCGELCRVDSEEAGAKCPACGSPELIDTFSARDAACPKCKDGVLKVAGRMIS